MTTGTVDRSDDGKVRNDRRGLWRRFWSWIGATGFTSRLAIFLTLAAIASGVATFWALTESPPIGPDPNTVYLLLNVDLIILLLLGAVVARRLVAIYLERRRGQAGARLHIRLAARFSLVAIVPAIVVATFSALFFQFGLQAWFSERVQTALNESLSVAEAYLNEHQQVLRADALAMANDLNREAARAVADPVFFNRLVDAQANLRDLTEAVVVDGAGRVLARSRFTFALQFETLTEATKAQARQGEVVLLPGDTDDRVRAVVGLQNFVDTYLLIGRFVEASVIGHMERTQGAVAEYQQLQSRADDLQVTFTAIYVVVALLLLLVSVWFGLMFADSLVAPIGQLIVASRQVGEGRLSARVPISKKHDELASLGQSFNNMIGRLESQQSRLVEANEELEERNRFTQAVLTGVTAGVIGLDKDGVVTLPNRSAINLLGLEGGELVGKPLAEAVPEMGGLLGQAKARPNRVHESQVTLRRSGASRTLLVRVTTERTAARIVGYVMTFDDITALLSAQRKAAWADVARRIAHEIKNPLTPIQLSAERLKRRYLKQVTEDPETFTACTDTIVRQVGDIGRMVDEFSAFARMPSPVMKPEDLRRLVREAVDLQRYAYNHIRFAIEAPDQPVRVACDARQVGQLLTNILQNAIDSIDGRVAPGETLAPGQVSITLVEDRSSAILTVDDNGRGLPELDHERLTEPYVTTREKGTGLGLAIVKKIVEDHEGQLTISNRTGGGARITIVFPLDGTAGPVNSAEPGDSDSRGDPLGDKPKDGTAD